MADASRVSFGMTPDPRAPLPGQDPERWDAIARYLAGESAPAEAAEVRRWLEEHPRDAALVSALDGLLDHAVSRPAAPVDVEGALARVHGRMDAPAVVSLRDRTAARSAARAAGSSRPAWRTPLVRAAALLAIAGGGAAWWSSRGHEGATAAALVHETGVGERDSVRLADGTLAVLGPQSRLEVTAGYGAARRDVRLVGEGFFEVTHDDARPFTVLAGDAAVRDIGTAFTVRATRGAVRVAVTEGAVLLRPASRADAEGVVLHEGDVGRLDAGAEAQAERGVAGVDELAWRSGRLVFRDAPLDEVAAALSRWYGVELEVADSTLRARRLTASFEGEPVERVLQVIGLALGAEAERSGKVVRLRARGGVR